MLSDEEISQQLALLAIHRRTLAVYRRQQAMLGVLAPPGVANGIAETSQQIQQIKADLRAAGAPVEDLPDDELRPLALTSQLAPADRRNRDRMLQKVRAFWIAGVLEPSLRNAARLSLQFEQRPDLVAQPWEPLVQNLDAGGRHLPPDSQIGDVFDALGGELLILGTSGSGKTTLLLELTRRMLDRAEADETQPIPVVFYLASWAARRAALTAWLVDELNTRYDVPRAIGAAWVGAEQVLPLLDGLDEVPEEHRAACVEAINAFRRDHGLSPLAICSRAAEYEALESRLKLQGAIVIQPLTLDQIDSSLAAGGDRLAALRAALREDAALRELAHSPLMLNLIVLSYPEAALVAQAAGVSPDALRRRIFDSYIEHVFRHRSADSRYTHQQTIRWLEWLARAMRRESQAILFIERMQPGWLPAPEQRQLYDIGEGLGAGLSAGLGAGMFYGAAVAFSNLPLAGPIGRWWAGGIAAGLGSTARLVILLLIGLAIGLLAGIAGGLFYWLVSVMTTTDRAPPVASWRRPLTILLRAGGAIGLTVGLVVGGFYGVGRATLAGLSIGLVGGLVLALRTQPGRIQIIERLVWRWSRALAGAALGLGVGLPAGLLFWRIQDRPSWLVIWPVGAMLAFGLIFGLSGKAIETRTRPNQGIRRSARTALRVGGAVWLCVGLLIALAAGMPDMQVAGLADRSLFGLLFGLVAGLFFGLMYGGIACFQHVLLRLILRRGDAMPWRYADFLDYCADHILLYRVGGGYMFVHRLLLEYFAALDISRT